MNRAELASHIAADLSLTKAEADRMVAALFAAIGDALARDETVAIAGFGKFGTRAEDATRARARRSTSPPRERPRSSPARPCARR